MYQEYAVREQVSWEDREERRMEPGWAVAEGSRLYSVIFIPGLTVLNPRNRH